MLKIIDLLKGYTVIPDIDEKFVQTQLLKYIAVEYEEDLPEFFWLSHEAVEGLLEEKEEDFDDEYKDELEEEEGEENYYKDEEDEEDYDSYGEMDEIYRTEEAMISDELKSVLRVLQDYLKNNSEFIDADSNNKEDLNERGCYLAFEKILENPDFKIYGNVKKTDNPVVGYKLEVYDDELISDDFVGFGFTDSNGNYEISFNREDFSVDPLDFRGTPTLYLDVSELDRVLGEFKVIKRFNIPSSDCKEIPFEIRI